MVHEEPRVQAGCIKQREINENKNQTGVWNLASALSKRTNEQPTETLSTTHMWEEMIYGVNTAGMITNEQQVRVTR